MSAIPALKTALFAALRANPVLASAQTSWGHPGVDAIERECVFMDNASDTQNFRNLGQTVTTTAGSYTPTRDQDFEIDVVTIYRYGDGDQQVAEGRAWELANAVEDAVRADVSLAGVALWAGVARTAQSSFADGPQGTYVQIVQTVAGRARI